MICYATTAEQKIEHSANHARKNSTPLRRSLTIAGNQLRKKSAILHSPVNDGDWHGVRMVLLVCVPAFYRDRELSHSATRVLQARACPQLQHSDLDTVFMPYALRLMCGVIFHGRELSVSVRRQRKSKSPPTHQQEPR